MVTNVPPDRSLSDDIDPRAAWMPARRTDVFSRSGRAVGSADTSIRQRLAVSATVLAEVPPVRGVSLTCLDDYRYISCALFSIARRLHSAAHLTRRTDDGMLLHRATVDS